MTQSPKTQIKHLLLRLTHLRGQKRMKVMLKKGKGVDPRFTPKAPFPTRLVSKQSPHLEKILEIFSQVKVNIPLLDAIAQVPSYAKFLKDLCTKKRATNVPKKAFLAAHVSSILSNSNFPIKYKDPGCPTISCTIGNTAY